MSLLNKFTYRQKNIGLIVVALLLGFITYNRTVKHTLAAMEECNALEQQISIATNSPEAINNLQLQLNQMNALIGDRQEVSGDVQQQLLENISNYCKSNNMVIKKFPEAHRFKANEYTTTTHSVEVQGNFLSLLQLVYELENEFKLARMSSARFHTKVNLKTKKKELYATIYLQNIKKS
jgi:hypothetical protein